MKKNQTESHIQIYTQEIFDKIASALGIVTHPERDEFKNELERAARFYVNMVKLNNAKLTEGKERKKFAQLAQHLEKSKKLYAEIRPSIHRFYGGLYSCSSTYDEVYSWMMEATHDEFIFKPQFIEGIFDVLENASRQAMGNTSLRLAKNNKTDGVFFWLSQFADCWQKLSKIKLSAGRYYKETKTQKSKAVDVLVLIAAPLNKLVSPNDKITESKLAETLKLYTKSSDSKHSGDF